MKILLDTCALIWWSLDPDKLSQQAKEVCNQMENEKKWFSSINISVGNSYQN
jgi:PIN domain nuclease of toxin-antitoxin system